MIPPTIQALGVTQDSFSGRWRARGYVEGIGWLEAWGTSLIDTMEALQALAASGWRRRKRRRAERWNPLRRRMHEITKATDAEERPTYRLAESDG